MNKKVLVWLVALIITTSFCAFGVDYSYQAEDVALVDATVLGFDRDELNNSLILLRIDKIIIYTHNQSALYEPLETNQSLMLGFLWGHREVVPTNVSIEKGDRILARIGYHYNFTSHIGHLYSYEQICGGGEVKVEGECLPSECGYDEYLLNNRCVKLECKDEEGIVDHACVALDCKSNEIAKEHMCVRLECDFDEYATNYTCLKLVCDEDEGFVNHSCSKLGCNIFQKTSLHSCVFNLDILIGVLLFFIIILFFWYEEILNGFKKTTVYKGLISDEFYTYLLIVLIAAIFLLTPLFVRLVLHEPMLIGEEPYLHARIAQEVLDGKMGFFEYKLTPYHLLLVGVGRFVGVYLASVVAPPILGVLSMIALIQIFKRLNIDLLTKNTILIILASSPAFIYLFVFSTPNALAVFLTLAGLVFLVKNRKMQMFVGVLLFLLAALSGLFNLVLCFGIILLLVVKKKRRKVLLFGILVLVLLLTLPYHLINFTLRDTIYQFRPKMLEDSVTDFGALIGFSVFNLFLALSGFVFSWKRKREYALFYFMFFVVFMFGLFLNKNYNMYWNFVVVYFSGLGFVYLLRAKWELKLVKELTVLIILCGLIFSTIAYTKQLALMQPSEEVFEGLEWLKGEETGVVLSHYSRGYWIEYISDKPAFVDSGYNPKTLGLLNVSDQIFYSRDLLYTNNTFGAYNITYVFIDKEMRQGLVWVKEEQGFLFLLRNNETFKNLYNTPQTEVWKYIGGKDR